MCPDIRNRYVENMEPYESNETDTFTFRRFYFVLGMYWPFIHALIRNITSA